jgi:quercetin dioxygenase-like cupin family protein
MNRRALMIVGPIVVLALLVGTAVAQQITGGFLARGTLGKINAHNDGVTVRTKDSTDVAVAKFTFEPGSSSGWHYARGVVLAVVQSGWLQEYDEDCDKRVIKAGEAFYEEGDTHILRNVGKKNAVVRATFVVPSGVPTDKIIVPDEAPKGCDIK